MRRGAAAARRRRGRPKQTPVTLRCAAQPKPKPAAAARVQGDAEATRGTGWEARGLRSGREGGALRPPPHDPHPPPLPRAPSLPMLLVPSVRAVGARRSSGEGGNSPRSTRTVTGALAARLVVHYCTRGSKCRAHRARADALIGSAKRARASTAVPRTAMWDRRAVHANARAARRSASSPFRPLSRRIWVCCYCRPSSSVRRLTRCVCSPCTSVCPVVPVLAPQDVDIGPSTHRMEACVGLFPLESDFSQCAADTAALLGKRFYFVCLSGGGGGGGGAKRGWYIVDDGTFQLRRTRRAATRCTAQIARHRPHMGWPEL
jgi:hypothetical protein